MRTYTHGIIGYLLYLKGTKKQQILAVIGAMIPDLFLVLGAPFHVLPKNAIFDFLHNLFHHSVLHEITKYMHSFVIVVLLFFLSYFLLKEYIPFVVGVFSHVFIDLLTHQRSGYNHFLPFNVPHFTGGFHYGDLWFTIVEHLLVLVFIIWIWRKKK